MQALLTKLDLAKYPFTSEASEYIKLRAIDPIELANPEFIPILERGADRVKQGVFGGKISAETTQEDVDILAYPTALMLISMLADDRARRRYAVSEAKRAYELLRNEPPEKLLHIAVTTFEWDARIVNQEIGDSLFELAVHFKEYIRNSTRIRDLRWKLVNRVLTGGHVILPREDFARLLEEEVQAKVLAKTSELGLPLPTELQERVEPLRAMLKARADYFASEDIPREIISSAMPPCMKHFMSLLQSSKHISHMGRFALAAFLLNIGTSEEDLLKMFTAFSDFDERIARYQVEHIAGRRGSRRKYTAPNCDTMRTHGLCINPDNHCATISHPLTYYRRQVRATFRKNRRGQLPERKPIHSGKE